MDLFTINGSYGSLNIDCKTGKVHSILDTSYDGYEGEYDDIDRFNIEEWEKEYPGELLKDQEIDILDFGYWLKDGTYYEPTESFREEYRNSIKEQDH